MVLIIYLIVISNLLGTDSGLFFRTRIDIREKITELRLGKLVNSREIWEVIKRGLNLLLAQTGRKTKMSRRFFKREA